MKFAKTLAIVAVVAVGGMALAATVRAPSTRARVPIKQVRPALTTRPGKSFLTGPRAADWRRVHEAIDKGLPKTAIEILGPIVKGALRDRAWAEAVRAIAQRIALEGTIQGNKPEEKIRRMQAEIARAPAEMRPVMEAILAEWFWQYFQQNRWRFVGRTQTGEAPSEDFTTWDLPRIYSEIDGHFTRALATSDQLRNTPIADFSDVIDPGSAPDAYRPTLYDFIAHEAIGFYASGEQAGARPQDAFELSATGPIFAPVERFMAWRVESTDAGSPTFKAVRLYQELLRFHAKEHDPSAFIDAGLWRLQLGKNFATEEQRNDRYKAALERLVERYPDHELSARALHDWATVLYEERDFVGARRLATRGLERFPESVGGRRCYNLIQQIEAPDLTIKTERVWNAPLPTIDVRYRNLHAVHLRVVRFDFDAWVRSDSYDPDYVDRAKLEALLKQKPVLERTIELPETRDFRERGERVPGLRGLGPGSYYLVASPESSFPMDRPIEVASFWVSDLALVVRESDRGAADGFVLDAITGDPLAGVEVRSWIRTQHRQPGPSTQTDENGQFRFPEQTNGAYLIVAGKGRQRLAAMTDLQLYRRDRSDQHERTLFFTDRALYRPGQTIQYKGLSVDADADRDHYEVIAGRTLTAVFADPNGKEIARQQHRTNDYGSFSGSFTAPRDRVLGAMTIRVEGGPAGYANLSVEEYKRPKFQVTLEAPKQSARLDETVSLDGTATAYTGAPIDGAEVRWRVVREVRYPDWWTWRWFWRWPAASPSQEIAHGTTRTSIDGTFGVSFIAKPDRSAKPEGEPTFYYSIHADVTDGAGETRSTDRTVSVGYVALAAGLSADEWQTSRRPIEISIRTHTLDGTPQAEEGVLKVFRLEQPERVERAQLAAFETYGYGLETTDSEERTPDASNPATWPEAEVAFERRVATDTSGIAKVRLTLPVGLYRARLETHDRFGKPVKAELQLRVLDPDAAQLAIRVPDVIVAQSWTVEPGQEFLALWGTGYERGRAFVEIEHRGKLVQSYWTSPTRTQVAIRQRVDESMRGGFAVRVTFVRENRAYLHAYRVDVPWSNKQLALKWEHFVSKLEPGKRETWTAVVSGPDATRATAEMVATLYDASLDAFRPNGWPGIGAFRYEDNTIRARFENRAAALRNVTTSWPIASRDGSLDYRRFPPVVVWNYGGYGWASEREAYSRSDARMLVGQSSPPASAPMDALADAAVEEGVMANAKVAHSRGGRAEETKVSIGSGQAAASPDLSRVSARRNLNETAFFFPHLIAGRNGEVRLEFVMPEALTEWRFIGFAHDRELRSGMLEGRAVTSRELMVQPNPPRFLREGDALEFTVKVTNRSDQRQTGRARLSLADARTGESVDAALGNLVVEQRFDIPAAESRTLSWRLQVPDGAGFLTYKAVAATDRVSDGEEGMLPVLSRRVLVTESLPLPIRGPQRRDFDFARLRGSMESTTLRHQALTVQMVSNPSWYAVMALPYLMEFPYECTEQTFNRLYANALARHIAASDPKIRRVFDQWRGTPALDSPLEKNQDLKAVMLEETPWLRQAQSESQARRNVGILFDEGRLASETERLVAKLAEQQLEDGAWPWFPGGRGDDYITLYITTGFGRLRHLGVKVESGPAVKSLARLDGWADRTYRDILQHGNKDLNHLTPMVALYLYGRSFFLDDRAVAPQHKEAVDYWLGQARRYWLQLGYRQSQAHLAIALKRFGDDATARGIMRSVAERAVHDEELGMYWRDLELSWSWFRAPIETQALMIEAFAEVMQDYDAVEDCKVWLLKQKQTQDWKTTKATADAVYALLLRGTDLLASDQLVEVSLGGQTIRPEAVEAGTGFYEQRFAGGEVKPEMGRVTVVKTDKGVAWGSVHWQYFEDMTKITPYEGTPLTLKKTLFTRQNEKSGPVLHPIAEGVGVGDELLIRIELRVDRDMEYVHLKDYRGSGTEPTNVLSGYRYQDGLGYYEQTRDAATHFFIDYLPKGTYVFEYPVRVQHRGRYQTGMAEIQCMYAPEFGGHSGSTWLEVTEESSADR